VLSRWQFHCHAEFLPKVMREIVVSAEQVRPIVDPIQQATRTGQTGNGNVLFSHLRQVAQFWSGETLDTPLATSV